MFTSNAGTTPSPAKKLICFFDFDGTLTSLDGSRTVFSDLYQSLCEPMPVFHYNDAKFKPDFLSILKSGLALESNKKLRLTAEAYKTLQTLINKQAIIYLISRNRSEYIQAMLELAGIQSDDLHIIGIIEMDKKNKDHHVYQLVQQHQDGTPIICGVADDSPSDAETMRIAARDAGAQQVTVCPYAGAAGEFKWDSFLDKLNWLLSTEPEETASLRFTT